MLRNVLQLHLYRISYLTFTLLVIHLHEALSALKCQHVKVYPNATFVFDETGDKNHLEFIKNVQIRNNTSIKESASNCIFECCNFDNCTHTLFEFNEELKCGLYRCSEMSKIKDKIKRKVNSTIYFVKDLPEPKSNLTWTGIHFDVSTINSFTKTSLLIVLVVGLIVTMLLICFSFQHILDYWRNRNYTDIDWLLID